MSLTVHTGADNPILRKKSLAVKKFDKKLKKFISELAKMMQKKDGVGLAAPQVGVHERVIVINFSFEKKQRLLSMINPVMVEFSEKITTAEEGCLSLPKIFAKVTRPVEITVHFQDESGADRALQLIGLNARVVQHEVDHLDGILFIDRAEEGSLSTEACKKNPVCQKELSEK